MVKGPSHAYLEILQLRAYLATGRVPDDVVKENKIKYEEQRKRLVEDFTKQQLSLLSGYNEEEQRLRLQEIVKRFESVEIPTPYQDPNLYVLISQLANDVKENFKTTGTPDALATQPPLVGTMPTGLVNARTISVPGADEYLVVFDDELFTFCNLLAKVVGRALPLEKMKFWDEQLRAARLPSEQWVNETAMELQENVSHNQELLTRFHDLIHSYLVKGRPTASESYLLGSPFDILAFVLTNSMEMFVIGHEYGHLYNGDLKKSKLVPSTSSGSMQINERLYDWDLEYDADKWGLTIMLGSVPRYRIGLTATRWDMHKINAAISLCYWGAYLFLTGIKMIEEGTQIMRTGKYDERVLEIITSASHPPTLKRRDNLQKIINDNFLKQSALSGILVEGVIQALWKDAPEYLEERYRLGDKLHKRWQL